MKRQIRHIIGSTKTEDKNISIIKWNFTSESKPELVGGIPELNLRFSDAILYTSYNETIHEGQFWKDTKTESEFFLPIWIHPDKLEFRIDINNVKLWAHMPELPERLMKRKN